MAADRAGTASGRCSAIPSGVLWAVYAGTFGVVFVRAPESGLWAVVVLGILLAVLDARPLFPFLLVMAAVAFGYARDVAGGLTVYATDLAIPVLCAGWVSREVRDGIGGMWARWRDPMRRMTVPTGVVVGMLALSSLRTIAPADTAKWAVHALEAVVVYLFALRFLPAADPRDAVAAVLGLGCTGAAGAVLGIVQYTRSGMDYFAVQGMFGQHNPFAAHLTLAAVPCAALALSDDRVVRRCIAGALTVVAMVGIAVSFSRGAWMGLFAGLGTVAALRARHRMLLVLLVCVLVPLASIVGYLAVRGGRDTERVGVSGLAREFGPRVVHYLRAGARMAAPRPALGSGPGTYRRVAARAVEAGLVPDDEYIRAHPHNLYVLFAVETGLLGLAAFLGWAVWHLASGVGAARSAHEPIAAALMTGATGAAAAFLVHSLFDVVATAHLDLVFGAVCGALASRGRVHGPAT
jgi:O-antigen ligase